MVINVVSVQLFKKNLTTSKPSEHPPSGEKLSKDLGRNIGCRDTTLHGIKKLCLKKNMNESRPSECMHGSKFLKFEM